MKNYLTSIGSGSQVRTTGFFNRIAEAVRTILSCLDDLAHLKPNRWEDIARATFLYGKEKEAAKATGSGREPDWNSLMNTAAEWRKRDRLGLPYGPDPGSASRLLCSRTAAA